MIRLISISLIFIIFSEIASYLIYRSRSLKGIRNFYDSILRRPSGKDDIRTFSLRYAEHPFLALTSNPEFRNSFGEKIHNKYGFRHTGDFTDIDSDRDFVVYCTGGSSTYCNFIERNEDTWPGQLEKRLSAISRNIKVRVVNGSCPGWTSFQ